ncbi:MAG TPA: LpqB family beta-propeller domain-containing protein [Candidatus Baltobacteraceae bacterium]|jgi:dipeptidyl aminopeptidase/acylaminoacyl peptidase|nr:LpqB family beta-propeller domain-containing protein [Candidatus Baltobacteraceae bacterium]
MVRRGFTDINVFNRSLASLILLGALGSTAGARTLDAGDIPAIVTLQQPAISPDGSRIAIVVIRPEQPELLLVNVRTAHQTVIARGGDVADPRWSPDGSALAFLQRDRLGGHMQLFVTGFSRGSIQRTHAAGDVNDMAWNPTGDAIAFSAYTPPSFNPGYFEAGANDYTATAVTPPVHLSIVPAAGGPERRLTFGTWTLAPTDSSGIFSPQFAWSHDGKHIIFTRIPTTFSGQDEYSTLWEADVRTGKLIKLTRHSALELSPSFSPDGSTLLYSYARDGNYLAFNSLRLRNNGNDRDLTAHFDLNAGGAIWMPGGRALLTCGNLHTRTAAWLLFTAGGYKRLNLGPLNILCDSYMSSTFDSGIAATVSRSGAIAFLATTAHHARELYYMASAAGTPRALTHFNDAIARLQLGNTAQIHWTGRGGYTEYGALTFPPGMIAGKKYPILVNIHGGPGDSSLQNFAFESWPRAQLFAAHGYIVYEPNYRGSDDAGNAFALAIYRDTVSGPADDILRGLAVVAKLPQADGTRVGVCGWSYGGLLTSWLITQHHFWKAAVSGAAVNDEIEEYALSTSNIQDRYYLGTSPFAPGGASVYRTQSPITYAAQVTTPTLLWATTLDPVVPIPQMYSFYHALQEHGTHVRFVVFPAPTHGPVDEKQTVLLTRLWLRWLDAYLRPS